MRRFYGFCIIFLLITALSSAQIAYDIASNSAYDDGWQDGDNGGYGWGVWNRFVGGEGTSYMFVGDSNTNGSGGTPGVNTSGRSWGLHADGAGVQVSRSLLAPMPTLHRMTMEFDTGAIPTGNRYQQFLFRSVLPFFYFVYASAAVPTYRLYLPGGENNVDTGIAINDGGIVYTIEDNGNGTYTASLHAKRAGNGADFVWTRPLLSPIQGLGAVNSYSGSGSANNAYINNARVDAVPEPASLVAVVAGGLGLLRRKCSQK